VGGNARYLQNILSGSHYTPIYKDKVIMKISARGGITNGISKKVRLLDNFYAQDTMIRGFEYNGIGPRDAKTLQPLGGKKFLAGSVEVKFPLGLPNEVDVNGIAFSDVATLYDIDVPNGVNPTTDKCLNSKKLRMSYGVGVIWNSPLGIIRLEYGIPASKASFDHINRINFSVGKSF
jgi:outer membrane protein insertion porin family